MTMGDETLFASMALPCIIGPILDKLEQRDMAAAQTLRAAFQKVEHQYTGFSYDLVKGVLQEAEVLPQIDMSESILRLEGMNHSDEFTINRQEDAFRELNLRASNLKKILSRIPDEIYDRKTFLDTIKDIASAIKSLLDAVNNIFDYVHAQGKKQELDQRKREFVRYSKMFSNKLKEFFKENTKQDVFLSANHLIHQTNRIMQTVKEACP